jgi:hypothetical protein
LDVKHEPDDGLDRFSCQYSVSVELAPYKVQLGSVTTDRIINVGTDPGELRNWLSSNGGRIPMLYADDAIVVGAALQLTTAAVPEPATWVLAVCGVLALLALLVLLVRRRFTEKSRA